MSLLLSLWLALRAWFFFIVSIYFSTLCVSPLRKQWMENERLLFPLATLPLQPGRQSRIRGCRRCCETT